MDDNPETVQPPSPSHPPSALPLILIHDGGGTSFAYHCLPPLPRAVYAIRNPRFDTGGRWAGGVREMAAVYAGMIRALISSSSDFPRRGASGRPEILLGGWSLGGYLSLQISTLLGADVVKGIVMVDSPFPSLDRKPVHGSLPPLAPSATRAQKMARECIRHASGLLDGWLPDEHTGVPAVLVRARDPVPADWGRSPVDERRGESDLGWKGRCGVRAVLEVRGHHFDVFEFARVDETGRAIERACRELEGR